MDDAAAALLRTLQSKHDDLCSLAERAIAANPRLGAMFGAADIDQLMRAFQAILVEALEGRDPDVRTLVRETTIPAAIAEGATVADLVQANVTFSILLTEILSDFDEPVKRDARLWLADFMGTYAYDNVLEAQRARAT